MKKKILVVDDEPDLVKAIEIRLRANSFETSGISEGKKVLREVERFRPNLILLDLFMPETDGFEVWDQLKREKRFRNIPVIVFTAGAKQSIREKALQRGMNVYITKPLDMDILLAQIHGLLGTKKAPPPISKKILIIDDEPELVKAMEIRLKAAGFKVTGITESSKSLKKTEEFKPDHILLDVVMPGVDGWALCREIKRNPQTKKTKTLLFTASTEIGNLNIRSAEVGAEDFIIKPFEITELLNKINAILKI